MGFLDHSDVSDCKAQHRIGEVTAVNVLTLTLDVKINGVVHTEIDVHYHCYDEWKEHSHPHTNIERETMLSAFSVGDQVYVLCDDSDDDNLNPLYVDGFVNILKPCLGKFCLPVLTKATFSGNTPTFEGRFDWYELTGEKGSTPTDRSQVGDIFLAVINIETTKPYTFLINGISMDLMHWDSMSDADWYKTGAPETFSVYGTELGSFVPMIRVTDSLRDEIYYIYFVYGSAQYEDYGGEEVYSATILYPLRTKNIWSIQMQAIHEDFPEPEAYNRSWCIGLENPASGGWRQSETITAYDDDDEETRYIWRSRNPLAGASDPKVAQAHSLIKPGCSVGYHPAEICQYSHAEISCWYDFQLLVPMDEVLGVEFRVIGSHLESLFDEYELDKPADESIEVFFNIPDAHKTLQW